MSTDPDSVPTLEPGLDELGRSEHLVVVTDLDGTVIPFAPSVAEAHLDDDAARILRALIEVGVRVFVVSGRPREMVEQLIPRVPGAWWSSEHGAWRWESGAWVGGQSPAGTLDELYTRLESLAVGCAGARVERKAASVCLHWRQVPAELRPRLVAEAELVIDEWLEAEPEHERLGGADLVEVRPRSNHKGVALAWLRQELPDARILALGDDLTDEDLFRALADRDLGIRVGRPTDDLRTHARGYVTDVGAARQLLRWIAEGRAAAARTTPQVQFFTRPPAVRERAALVVVSNRTPARPEAGARREVGGLVSSLGPALLERGGTWLGWSGAESADTGMVVDDRCTPGRASFDLTSEERRHFYAGFCNRSLWPLLHGFPGRVRYEDDEWARYVEVNRRFATHARSLAAPDAPIWVHDYHLFLVGEEVRRLGHGGPLGFFLHVPFPAIDVLETLPWAREILRGLLAYDVVGFQTDRHTDNFCAAVREMLGVIVKPSSRRTSRRPIVRAFPIGIDPAPFAHDRQVSSTEEVEGLLAARGQRRILLGVDRLDYSKGVPERLEAFERLLERHPRWQRRVSMIQISVPSRADVPEYAELRHRVENLVGRINGRFGEADWVPVRYLYRAYDQELLAQLYRAADVAVVTPLRDGMNLVAKEFVAAQDPARPGVLLLSAFAGAATELKAAILTNPYHRDGLADDMNRALSMPADERRARHGRLRAAVLSGTAARWSAEFLGVLTRSRSRA